MATATPSLPRIEASGLEDVVAATTRLSDVDGDNGRLVLAGSPVEDVAGTLSFEQAIGLLWHGSIPTPSEATRIREALGEAREAAYERIPELGDALALPDAMDALRAAMGHLAVRANEDPFTEALRITAATAVFAAAWARSPAPLRPDPRLGHAADYLRMVTGHPAAPPAVAALDAYLVTVVDHGMNASTFAARVVASTASDTVSAVVAAIGALKGRLHGGAPGPVLDMLDAIGEPAAAHAWMTSALARGERIMGMGHRVYRVRDPRAFVLERAVARLEAAEGSASSAGRRLHLARAVENEAVAVLTARHPDRPLKANVEFYTAILLEAIGLPRTLFTPTFAASRVFGWCAHVNEQRAVGRLIRPKSRYVDAPPRV
ncbi:Citrate synthase (si) [Labilithrix luteola]|uniref:Citrate synthase n=1 Tax=Labilithrix luteola TaxID=1391654 RepID=A0A0K1QB26_9BACT|nr:citrate synthase [Labilithrix luteola]AKV02991.1 Citrate synthase (si) [Labilithrix luteola]